jgi:hypothetical protein
MKASVNEVRPEAVENAGMAPGTASADCISPEEGVDVGLLKESLAKTPWERMQANDDALRFADSLRAAMENRNAKPQRADTPTR